MQNRKKSAFITALIMAFSSLNLPASADAEAPEAIGNVCEAEPEITETPVEIQETEEISEEINENITEEITEEITGESTDTDYTENTETVTEETSEQVVFSKPEVVFEAEPNASVKKFVQSLYKYFLSRNADSNGLEFWTKKITDENWTAAKVIWAILSSDEYQAKTVSDEQFASMLINVFYGREGNSAEISEIANDRLGAGHTRKAVLRKFILSEEFAKQCKEYGIVPGDIEIGGWDRFSSDLKCYISEDTGMPVTGYQMINNIHCYFDEAGVLRTDWSDLGSFVDRSSALYSYESMVEDISMLEQQYPSLVTVQSIGITADRRQIYDMIIGNPNAKRQLVVQAGCHAREYMGCQLVMTQTENLLKNYWSGSYGGKSYKNLLEDYCIHIIPMLNPDGVTLSQYGIDGINSPVLKSRIRSIYQNDYRDGVTSRSFEDYLKSWKSNALGVDLNRNFDWDWSKQNEIKRPSTSGYTGLYAASEAEVQSLTGLISSLPNVQTVVSYHSSGSYIYWAYGQTGEFRQVSQSMAQGLSNETGYYLLSQDDTGGGGCSNWVAGHNIRATTIEIGSGDSPLPISQFDSIWNKNKNVIPYMLSLSDYNENTVSQPSQPTPDQESNSSDISGYVTRMYNTILSRNTKNDEVDYWTGKINGGLTASELLGRFTESKEFVNKNYSDDDYLDHIYAALYDRQPSEDERAYRISMLQSGYTRLYVLRELAYTKEFQEVCDSYGIERGMVRLAGWQKEMDGVFYYEGGNKVKKTLKNLDGYTYYFDDDGRLGQGWYKIGENYYYACDGLIFPSNGTDWGTEFQNGNVRRNTGTAVKLDVPLDFQFLYNRVICTFNGDDKTVNSSGCGAASSSMVIRYLTDKTEYDPETLFEWAYKNGEYFGYGLAESTLTKFMDMAEIKSYWVNPPSADEIREAIKQGRPVIALALEGYFTTGGHYIVITGITDDGYITVNDPNNSTTCVFEYKLETVLKQFKCIMVCYTEDEISELPEEEIKPEEEETKPEEDEVKPEEEIKPEEEKTEPEEEIKPEEEKTEPEEIPQEDLDTNELPIETVEADNVLQE